jgi:predicted RNA-binding Zn-ribbon protein involved in translation (DUF1610 family)
VFNFLKGLFFKRCPKCGSFNIIDRTAEVMSMTYNLYYACEDCYFHWKESGL